MAAYQGDVDFEHQGSGGMGRMPKKTFTGEGMSLMKVSGSGDVFLAQEADEIFLVPPRGRVGDGQRGERARVRGVADVGHQPRRGCVGAVGRTLQHDVRRHRCARGHHLRDARVLQVDQPDVRRHAGSGPVVEHADVVGPQDRQGVGDDRPRLGEAYQLGGLGPRARRGRPEAQFRPNSYAGSQPPVASQTSTAVTTIIPRFRPMSPSRRGTGGTPLQRSAGRAARWPRPA